jgi:myo-inositol 2-dehydrogenase/D-chiro-inositol 1-dehydrogenase
MIDSTYMVIMGQIACYTGKPVTWDPVVKSDFEFEPRLADVTLDLEPSIKPDATGNYPLPLPGLTKFL